MSKGTLTQLFFTAVDRHAGLPAAFRSKVGGAWTGVTHREALERVQAISLGLRELGIQPGDKVAMISENRPEWSLSDYACLCSRATDVPIYTTLPAKQTEYILRDSESVAVLCSTALQLDKVLEVRNALPGLKHIIAFDAGAAAQRPGIMSLADLEKRGRAAVAKYPDWKKDALSVRPEDLATLIYTSGTTGDPKGVMLSHYNLWSNVQACLQMIPIGGGDECLSMLPLSHSYERMVDYTLFQAGVIINYAESFDTVAANLLETRPTVVLSVPRLYEKVYARVLENALSGSAIKRSIFFWAKRTGDQWATLSLAGLPIPAGLAIKKKVADRLVFSKLRARTGGRIRFFVSGAAALSAEIVKFFYSAGLPIIEGYGLTETSPVLTLNPLDGIKIGTVGRAIPGVELKIAGDGEILARGPNIMQGYYKLPEATADAIDPDGWFHTGDIGELDSDGYLKITDRKKDLFKTAGGKYVAPQPIEAMAKQNKFVAQAVVFGDRRKFPIILVVPNFEVLKRWAAERSLAYGSNEELIALPDVQAKVEREVMSSLHNLAKFETPKKVVLLPQDFSIETGELTPKLSVKRRVVETKYKEQIDAAYTAGDALAAAIESGGGG
ncbi:MAG TPA: long-chain fatty acid--CoA ligase [Gemmatimonadales bacterium]|nr:long-chain fatty acid--CoA ligase [Gemmatimonadales bacterium]